MNFVLGTIYKTEGGRRFEVTEVDENVVIAMDLGTGELGAWDKIGNPLTVVSRAYGKLMEAERPGKNQ